MKKILIISTFFAILALFLLNTKQFYTKNSKFIDKSQKFTVIIAKNITKNLEINTYGRLEPDSLVELNADSSGKVKKILVNKGEFVKKDDKIAVLDDVLESNLNYQEIDLPQIQIDEKNEKKIKKTQIRPTEKYITSPCDGYVNEIYREIGSSILIGLPGSANFASIACVEKPKFSGSIATQYASKIHPGSQAQISNENWKIDLKITSISKIISDNGGVKFYINANKKILDKVMIFEDVDIKIIGPKISGTLIPKNAVLANLSGNNYIYTINESEIIEKKQIKILDYNEEFYTISAVKNGEKILISGINKVKENDKIEYEILDS